MQALLYCNHASVQRGTRSYHFEADNILGDHWLQCNGAFDGFPDQ